MAIQSSNKEMFTEINITPLTDIFLVLLIIMMVIAPMFQSLDNDIKLPAINSGLSVEEDLITVSVTKDAKFFVGTEVVDENKLSEKLAEVLPKEEGAEKKLVVKADSQTKTKYIMSVMTAAQTAGFEKLTVAGEPLSQERQKELERGEVEKITSNNDTPDVSNDFSERHRVNLPQ